MEARCGALDRDGLVDFRLTALGRRLLDCKPEIPPATGLQSLGSVIDR